MSEKMVLGMGRMRMETVNSHKCLFGDFWIPYGPTSTPHIHIKTDNDCYLLTQIFFCSVSQKTHCLAHSQLFLTQTYPQGLCVPAIPHEEPQLYWAKDRGEASDSTVAKSMHSDIGWAWL